VKAGKRGDSLPSIGEAPVVPREIFVPDEVVKQDEFDGERGGDEYRQLKQVCQEREEHDLERGAEEPDETEFAKVYEDHGNKILSSRYSVRVWRRIGPTAMMAIPATAIVPPTSSRRNLRLPIST